MRAQLPTAVALMALLSTTACSEGGGGGPTGPAVPAPALAFPERGEGPGDMVATRAFPNLDFNSPVFVTHSGDSTDRLFVLEQNGRILTFANDDATTSATVFLDLRDRVSPGGEEGLLGLAFPPDYASSGQFYVYYSAANPRRSVLSRFDVTTNPDVADPASESIVLTVSQPYSNHNAGMIAFGPDDMLYVALGDGGSANDPLDQAQDRTTLLGSMLRIDPTASTPYGIPGDNPFVGLGNGTREEIWAYGLRNPWRFSFDRANGEMWLGDVGQGSREEIDFVTAGDNLGWPLFEGSLSFRNPQNLAASAFTEPVFDYPHSEGRAVIGGYVYRGARLPELDGIYLFGDYTTGLVSGLVTDSGTLVRRIEIASVSGLASFGEDESGEVLLVSRGGTLARLDRVAGGPPSFPQTLSATGLFRDITTLTPSDGVIPYEVRVPLWSDGAHKRRWFAVPETFVGYSREGPWTFPVGMVLVKHFEIETGPGQIRRLETRVLIHEPDGWAGYTYRWRPDQTEADLLPGRATDTITLTDPAAPGGTRDLVWTYPGRTDCTQCHTEASGRVLGFRAEQVDFDPGTGEQLAAFEQINLFGHAVSTGAARPFPALDDPQALLADRARAWIHVHCAMCHQPDGPAPVDIDLRWITDPDAWNAIRQHPQAGDLGLQDPRIILPADPNRSILWERMGSVDGFRMPPLGAEAPDPQGLELVRDWILSLR